MIRAIVWKELREQGLILAMLAALGSGLLVAAAMFADPPASAAAPGDIIGTLGVGKLLAVMLIVTAGMVCGGVLFAAERESGTMPFLDALPSPRRGLWVGKVVAGVVLVTLEGAFLIAVAWLARIVDAADVGRFIIYATMAFAWGVFGSTYARTTLGSVGIALPAATLAAFVFLVPIILVFSPTGTGMPRTTGWLLFEILMVASPLVLSAWRFTALDRQRLANESERPGQGLLHEPPDASRAASGWGLLATAWLTYRQLRGPVVFLAGVALFFGGGLLLPEVRPLFVWPPLALVAGVIMGVLVLGDEQINRLNVFWGEFRLPIGRAWWVKVAVAGVGLLLLLVVLALPLFLRSQIQPGSYTYHGSILSKMFQSRLFDELGWYRWKYLAVPAVYGFVFGHVCGLLFRKMVVACGVATILGGMTAAVWIPSLLAGGLKNWQLWLPALVILLGGRLILRPWSAERLLHRGPLGRLSGLAVVAVLVISGALFFRVWEIPEDPYGEDDLAFIASLPSYDENLGGREFRIAAERFQRVAAALPDIRLLKDNQHRLRMEDRLDALIRMDWDRPEPEFIDWLDRVFAAPPAMPDEEPWHRIAAGAAAHPVGCFDHPQLVNTMATTVTAMENARKMALALLLRGLQRQSQAGDPAAFVPAFRIVLKLCQNIRYGGGAIALDASMEIERRALDAADVWLGQLPRGYPQPLRELVQILAAYDEKRPFDVQPHILADRYVMREMTAAPGQMLFPPTNGKTVDDNNPEGELLAFAWAVPWERERTRRLIGLPLDFPRERYVSLAMGRPGLGQLFARIRGILDADEREMYIRTLRRGTLLKCAIRTYQELRGVLPQQLEELLTAGLLETLPADPFRESHTFGYRISPGERLRGPGRFGPMGRPELFTEMPIESGRVLLWSVGIDGADQGGKSLPGTARTEDIVFLLPPDDHKLSANNLRQIGQAFHAAAKSNTDVFPGDITDAHGRPLLSWRVALLPYLGGEELYRQFRLEEPWDSPHNRSLITQMPAIYQPVRGPSTGGETFYQRFRGSQTAHDPSGKTHPATIPDGADNTLLVCEAGTPVIWTQPADIPFDPNQPLPSLGGLFNGDFHVLMCDGHVYRFRHDAHQQELKKLIITNDGKKVELEKLLRYP
ncbi:MAG: DUF1559 domain-containing protein [Gemmataceae bacterium]|nr:DUF1559 domain-containing protein [Gemmata sp.]MDW8199102.1 DUF1559 domain-containing protein [Gemmataceae bacterium]